MKRCCLFFGAFILLSACRSVVGRCPVVYCSYCTEKIVQCSGHEYPISATALITIVNTLSESAKYRLEVFTLSHANIPSLPRASVENFRKLRKLSITSSKIRFLENTTFSNMTSLQELSLRMNELKLFSFTFIQPVIQLEMLDLSSNYIIRIYNPRNLTFISMRELNLAGNDLNTIEDNVLRYLPNLEILVLRKNPLQYFTNNAFDGLGNLRMLDLSLANIMTISEGYFGALGNLVELNMEHSLAKDRHVVFPSKTFQGLSRLKKLTLMNNSLDTLSDWLRVESLKDLKYLDLSVNAISMISNYSFLYLRSLETLKLSHMTVPMSPLPSGAFSGLTNLNYLDLQGNNMTKFPSEALKLVPNATVALAYGNKFKCSCQYDTMKIKIRSGLLKTDIFCVETVSHHMFLSQISQNDLGCVAPSLNSGKNETTVLTNEGSIARIICNATSLVDFPQVTFYAIEGDPLPEKKIVRTEKNIKILPSGRKLYIHVKLILVENFENKNSGTVVCSTSNKYGTTTAFVNLSVHVRQPPLDKWMIIVVCILVTLLIVIIIIAVVVTCKRRHNTRCNADSMQGNRGSQDTNSQHDSDVSDAPESTIPQTIITETSL